jgi:hypothetical protein
MSIEELMEIYGRPDGTGARLVYQDRGLVFSGNGNI